MTHLVLTSYLQPTAGDLDASTRAALPGAVAQAAARIDGTFTTPTAVSGDHTLVIDSGLDVLDGTTIAWDGDADLTTLSISVPWPADIGDRPQRVIAASHFARALTTTLQVR